MRNLLNNKTLVLSFAMLGLALLPKIGISGSLPDFEQYQVKTVAQLKPDRVNLSSHPKAKRFRTMLREGAKKGPNFAGHYTIVTWGCGTACQELAIVDALDGSVFFSQSLQLNAYHMVTDKSAPFQFQLDSRLLIITGSPNDSDESGIFYYSWNGKRLKRIYAVPKIWQGQE